MIETKQLGPLEYLVCQGIPVPHCFTTRLGGISSGYLSSLNIGTSRGDDPNNVIENYRRLGDALGFDIHNLVLSRQTHSDIVYTATEKDRGAGLFAPHLEECDGLITAVPGLALVVFTADCTPPAVLGRKNRGGGRCPLRLAGHGQRYRRSGGRGHGAGIWLPSGGHPRRHRPQHRRLSF